MKTEWFDEALSSIFLALDSSQPAAKRYRSRCACLLPRLTLQYQIILCENDLTKVTYVCQMAGI